MVESKAKRSRHRKARSQKRRKQAEARLGRGPAASNGGPVLGARPQFDVAERTRATSVGGLGAALLLSHRLGLAATLNRDVPLLERHLPYYESDHILAIALNALAGGRCLEDLEKLREDDALLEGLGVTRLPDPTTSGDFCRRFVRDEQVEALIQAIHEVRLRAWRQQPRSFFEQAVLDVDGTIVETAAECKDGIDRTYKGQWGYHPLLVSLANTDEPLIVVNRPGNAQSNDGAATRLDDAIDVCRRGGFRKILLRGDTAFSQTQHLDRWSEEGVGFVFGYGERRNIRKLADSVPEASWAAIHSNRRAQNQKRPRAKEAVVIEPRKRSSSSEAIATWSSKKSTSRASATSPPYANAPIGWSSSGRRSV